jgi:microcystin-dependent protein
MSLDFPANPTDGEVYGSYVWSETKGVWLSREESAAVTITSPVAPTTGTPGDLWFNSSTGILFTYYSDGTSAQWVEVLSSAVPNATEIMPAGTVTQTARITAPTGWLLCEGQAVSRTTFARLFDAIGTTYGTGDGSTTFTLPNLRGRVPVGRDITQTEFDVLGETSGAKTVTLDATQIPAHNHTGITSSDGAHTHTFSGTTTKTGSHSHTQRFTLNAASGSNMGGMASAGSAQSPGLTSQQVTLDAGDHEHTYFGTTSGASANHSHTFTTANNPGGGQAHNNLQPYIVLNYMIKV